MKLLSRIICPLIYFGVVFSDSGLLAQKFDCLYFGLTVGLQNVVGGSLVNGKDLLARDTRPTLDLNVGYRFQVCNKKLVLGPEISFGIVRGNLEYDDPTQGINVQYRNHTQRSLGGIIGLVIGSDKNSLVYVYTNEIKRQFDVTIIDSFGSYKQKDKQGMLRYGGGFEFPLGTDIHLRTSVGSGRADFGDQITNIQVNNKLDFMSGVVLQF